MFSESITPQEIEKLDYASFPGKIYVIDSVGAEFNRAIAYLRSQKIIGFDTETRPTFSQDQPRYGVALLQLSGPDKAFLFRINKICLHYTRFAQMRNDFLESNCFFSQFLKVSRIFACDRRKAFIEIRRA